MRHCTHSFAPLRPAHRSQAVRRSSVTLQILSAGSGASWRRPMRRGACTVTCIRALPWRPGPGRRNRSPHHSMVACLKGSLPQRQPACDRLRRRRGGHQPRSVALSATPSASVAASRSVLPRELLATSRPRRAGDEPHPTHPPHHHSRRLGQGGFRAARGAPLAPPRRGLQAGRTAHPCAVCTARCRQQRRRCRPARCSC